MSNFSKRIILLFPIALLVAAGAETKPEQREPKSPVARNALKKYDEAIEKAKASYDIAEASARKELSAGLDDALKAAMAAGSLDEANRINAIRSDEKAEPEQKPSVKLEVPRKVLGKWFISDAEGHDKRRIFLRKDHLVIHEIESLLGVWIIVNDNLSITWTSGVTDSLVIGKGKSDELIGRNSVGTPIKLRRNG